MKERIKRFYHDHKTKVVVGTAGVALAALYVARKRDEQDVVGVNLWHDENGRQMIQVGIKNGPDRYFTKKSPTAA